MVYEFIIDKKIDIKSFLLEKGFSLNVINKLLFEKNNIFINNNEYINNYMLSKNDSLKILINETSTVIPIDKPIDIVFEDEYFLVVNKEKGLSTIPSKAHFNDNLSARVKNYFNSLKLDIAIHPINRLDLLTSGLVVFAKSKYIHSLMSKINIQKKYLAIVSGLLEKDFGVIDKNIIKIDNSIKREINSNGKRAITEYSVKKRFDDCTLVDINLLTGRTHQIRVHFASIFHPLVGDKLYNNINIYCDEKDFFLCSYKLSFFFPLNNKNYFFELKDDLINSIQ